MDKNLKHHLVGHIAKPDIYGKVREITAVDTRDFMLFYRDEDGNTGVNVSCSGKDAIQHAEELLTHLARMFKEEGENPTLRLAEIACAALENIAGKDDKDDEDEDVCNNCGEVHD